MNIKILDSWLKDFLKTNATPQEIATDLSLASVSIERLEKYKNDIAYDIEITTNRPDLASVIGLAREAAAVLPEFHKEATFIPPQKSIKRPMTPEISIEIVNDPTLVKRVCAVIMEVAVTKSPEYIQDRLEASGIRSLNNVIDITNYVMRTVGHPTHVFDFDRLATKKLTIRKARKGETVVTLDKKSHELAGGDIVAVNDAGTIVDLLGVMGLENSVVTDETKRILFFIDNNDAPQMRKTSMSLGIRSEAVQLNEKGIDPELAMDALLYGISLYEKHANGKVLSDIIDIYPHSSTEKQITVTHEKIETVIGVPVPLERALTILKHLGFTVSSTKNTLQVIVPSFRALDVTEQEDIIEEIARVYGYHNLPSMLPPITMPTIQTIGTDMFFWEKRIKEAMKYWGYTEAYTYSSVSETQFEGPLTDAITLNNPLDEDHMYMRQTLIPSLLKVVEENKAYKTISLFEIANIYTKNGKDLPSETRMFAVVVKGETASFLHLKGLIEQLCFDSGIKELTWKKAHKGGIGADIYIGKDFLGEIEVLDNALVNMELNFEILTTHATLKRIYTPLAKFPPIIEDMSFSFASDIATGEVMNEIKKLSPLIHEVTLLDKYKNSRTFHILYQDKEKNLTTESISAIREKIITTISKKFQATLK